MEPTSVTLYDVDGRRVEVDVVDQPAGGGLTLRAHDGRRLFLPAEAIDRREGAHLYLTMRSSDLDLEHGDTSEVQTIPIVTEEAQIGTRARTTATVSVRTRTDEREEEVAEVLTRESVDVERVRVDRIVDAPAAIRQEGDTTIVPLHEEVLVVEKRLMVTEELHLTKRAEDRRETRRVSLRSERAEIERTERGED
jgi:stress response protein YsnF